MQNLLPYCAACMRRLDVWRAAKFSAQLVLSVVLVVLVIRAWPKPSLYERVPLSRAVYARDGTLLQLQLANDQRYRLWVPLAQISPQLVAATLLKEDRWFYYHPGVNPYRAGIAALSSYAGNVRQGASTLTMQLARLKYQLNTKRLSGKLQQVAYALWLEACYPKAALLEAYLNLAPYGGNIEGVASASLLYFNKSVSQLTSSEALTLAVLPQQPNLRTKLNSATQEHLLFAARALLYQQWQQNLTASERARPGFAAQEIALRAQMLQPVALRRRAAQLNLLAPHASNGLLQNLDLRSNQIHSTIDPTLQALLQRRTTAYLAGNQARGLKNAALLLLDTRTMELKAHVGSADFFNARIDGQVDGMRAKRSPGSTLKPFIYGLALDQGLIHPKTLLRDVPVVFGAFAPENFDRKFQGPVNATQALIRSRNTPAVSLSAQLNPDLYQLLEQAQVSQLASREHYGLALSLGGGELTGFELARLYAALANGGRVQPVRMHLNDDQLPARSPRDSQFPARSPRDFFENLPPSAQILSPEAAFLVRSMLEENPRPNNMRRASSIPVAWKTGTSWGFRDAWSVGLFGQYALVVWVGNFDGASHPGLVGRNAAAPLFFQLVDALTSEQRVVSPPITARTIEAAEVSRQRYGRQASRERNGRQQHVQLSSTRTGPPLLNLRRVAVCSNNGELPNQWCANQIQSWFIPGVSPITVSTLHQRAVINRSGQRVCNPALLAQLEQSGSNSEYRVQTIELWPERMADAFAQAGLRKQTWASCLGDAADSLGAQAQNASEANEAQRPEISAPLEQVSYQISAAELGIQGVTLRALGDGQIYWFVDRAFIGSSKSGEAFQFRPKRFGTLLIQATDQRGKFHARTLTVALK